MTNITNEAVDRTLDQIEAGTDAPTTPTVGDAPDDGASGAPIPIPPPRAPLTVADLAFHVRLLARRAEALQRRAAA